VTIRVPAANAHFSSPNSLMAMTLTRVAAEQDDTQHLVGLVEKGEGLFGPAISGLREMAQPVTVGGHHGRFAERKECREGEQNGKNDQLRG